MTSQNATIIIKGSMSQMLPEQQEAIWILSRKYTVYEQDANGVLWRILDLYREEEDGYELLRLREDRNTSGSVKETKNRRGRFGLLQKKRG